MNRTISGCEPAILLKLAIIFFWIGWAIFHSLHAAVNISPFHLDGAYQTASGLYRLHAGQFPGENFYPYLGVGPLYLLYPLFRTLGSDIAASIFSAHFTTAAVTMLMTAFIWHLIWRSKSVLTSLAAGILLFYFYILVYKFFVLFHGSRFNNPHMEILGVPVGGFLHPLAAYFPSMDWVLTLGLTPGNSLKDIRSFAPYLAAIIFYFFVSKISSARAKYAAAGVLTGSLLLWSNDYAISTGFLYAVLLIFYAQNKNELSLKNALIYLVISIIAGVALLSLATHGHPVELLKYNFLDVARNQWWYFAPYTESSRISSFAQLAEIPTTSKISNIVAVTVLAILAWVAWNNKAFEYKLLLWIGVALFAGAVVASAGGHFKDWYFYPLYYFVMTTIIVGCIRMLWPRISNSSGRASNGALLVTGIIMCIPFIQAIYEYGHEVSAAKKDANRFFVKELGGYLGMEWRDYIELARSTPQDQLVAEEYWGIWSAVRRTFFIWPVDSVIHAMGATRDLAKRQLQHADVVISTRFSNSSIWQPWNLSLNYWFYENLLKEWSVTSLSPATVVWEKMAGQPPITQITAECMLKRTQNGHQILNINVPEHGYYEMDIQYKITAPGRRLLLLQNNINFAERSDGYIPIDPYATEMKFPSYFKDAGQANLNLKAIGNTEIAIEISVCSARKISFSNEEVLAPNPDSINKRQGITK